MARCPACYRRLVAGLPCPTHGGSVAEATRPAPAAPAWPRAIGRFVGSGGFASVWELGDERVLKIAHVSHDLARARIAREAEALGAIGAPAVPQVYATGVLDDGRAWIEMQRVTGTTIAELTADGSQRAFDALGLAISILDALEGVHAAGFVHRDIKPDNLVRAPDSIVRAPDSIVRAADSHVVIIDLGLARKLPEDPDDPTRANVQVGSLEYMSPEQVADSAAVDARSDLYAFGCVLYELLAGRPPFVGDAAALERAHAALRPPRLGALATVSAAVEAVCNACLAKDPARRPTSAAEVKAQLIAARADDPSSTRARHASSGAVIREGKQPVVLLWAELPRVDRALLGALAARRLVIVSQRGRRLLAALIGGEHGDPAALAIAAARDLAAAGARVALHLEALRVGSVGGATTVHGDPVDKPETWLPTQPWSGVVLTRALAGVSQVSTREAEPGSEFVTLGDDRTTAELVGRDALLGDLIADAAAALFGAPRPDRSGSGAGPAAGPAFALLIGDAGVGKTAFATELARRLGELGARIQLGTVPAPGTGRPGHAALGELVDASVVGGSVVRSVGDALRAAARARPTVVILDDLHLAEHDLLDALEYATLGGEPLPLWVLGIAAPRIDVRRPQLGSRAERRWRDVLAPLDEDSAVTLIAALLRPAEYPPLRALRQLVAIARGNPLHLVMLARAIHERGAIRLRHGGAHYLDTSALDELSPAALGPWLAARELAALAPEVVAFARLCAVLGADVQRDELVAIVDTVERQGGATTTIDVDVGLAELVRADILVAGDRGYQFRQALVEEGVYATTNEDERLALHRVALDHWRGAALDEPRIAERVARHAELVGDTRAAAEAFAKLGEHAALEHRMLDADQAWSGALRSLPDREAPRARALLGRARARYRQQRVTDALYDLDAAMECADASCDIELQLDVLLERATVLDWAEDFAESAAMAAKVRARLTGTPSSARAMQIELAEGRDAFRSRRFGEAVVRLRGVMEAARQCGDHDAEMIAGVLLAPALTELSDLDAAEAVFAELIALCESRNDRLHLGAAYANRSWLWAARGQVERVPDDLRMVIQLAREIGQSSLERIGTYNLAEDLLWEGKLDEALPLARRCLAIQRAHGEGTTRPDRLLLARIHAAREDRDELAAILATFTTEVLAEDEAVIVAVVRCVIGREGWSFPPPSFPTLPLPLRIELAHLAATVGRSELGRRELVALGPGHAIWRHRLANSISP